MTPNLGGVGRSIGVERAGGVVEGPEFCRPPVVSGEGDGTLTEREAVGCRTAKLTRRVVTTRDGKGEGGIAVGAGKRQALKHGEVDVPGIRSSR